MERRAGRRSLLGRRVVLRGVGLYLDGGFGVTSGAELDTIFSEEMLAGGYRKKYLRAISRLLALNAGFNESREP